MTDNNDERMADLVNRQVVDTAGDKVGSVYDVYLDQASGQPEWLAISTGMFATTVRFVPIAGIGMSGEDVVVIYDRTMVKESPHVEASGQLSESEERDLTAYYIAIDLERGPVNGVGADANRGTQ